MDNHRVKTRVLVPLVERKPMKVTTMHEYNASVTQRVEVAPGLIILRVVLDGEVLAFEPGQYTVLGLRRKEARVMEGESDPEEEDQDPEKMIRRAYSIASSSEGSDFLEFYVTLVPSGELTPRLFQLGLKDRLHVGGKATGLFTLDRVPEDRHVLLVATGTGLAPYMSMLRTQLVCGGWRRFVILQGARFSWDLGYRAELTGLSRHCRNMIYLPVVSRPQADPSWKGLSGYLQDVLLSGIVEERSGYPLTPEHFHVFLCGNPGMIAAGKELLFRQGFVPDRGRIDGTIHTEEYW
jgi:ferredoxin--NADP+ reductase